MNYVKFSFIVLFLLTSISLINCSEKSKKYEQEDTQEWYIGKLKPEFSKYDIIYSDGRIYTLTPEKVFLYIPQKKWAYLKNGDIISLVPSNIVEKIDTTYFKFEYSKEQLLSIQWDELDEYAEIWHLDSINIMLKNIFASDFKPFNKC